MSDQNAPQVEPGDSSQVGVCPRRALGGWEVHLDCDAHAVLRPSAGELELGRARFEARASSRFAPTNWRGGSGSCEKKKKNLPVAFLSGLLNPSLLVCFIESPFLFMLFLNSLPCALLPH